MPDALESRSIRILVAESQELIRMGLRALFEKHPSLVMVAESDNLEEAVTLTAKQSPDVILLDLLLSNSHCVEHIPLLLQACPQNKILAFSTNHDEQTHLEVLRLGVTGIITKHQDTALLIKAILAVNKGQVWFDLHTTKMLWQNLVTTITHPPSTLKIDIDVAHSLTARECCIVCMASKGYSAKKIGEYLFLSVKTVRNQLTVIYGKLGVVSQVELCLKSPQLNLYKFPCQLKDRDKCPANKG